VGDTYIIVQKGLIHQKRYYLPKSSAEALDEDMLRLKVYETVSLLLVEGVCLAPRFYG
jgi:hypothetical protein